MCSHRAKECSSIPAKVIATCFSLIGFAAAVVVGLAAANATETILWRALIVMLVAWPIGWLVGGVAEQVVQRHIDTYKNQHPIVPDHGPSPEPTEFVDDQAVTEPEAEAEPVTPARKP